MMEHPNIARILDAGCTESGRPYFAMELVRGVPITRFCDENGLLPRQRIELFVSVCRAVQHAHQKGIIHRDLKPSNVLVALYDDHPVPKVIDFGVAKATNQQQLTEKTLFTGVGQIVGTFQYMSPEQAVLNQRDVDTRTDVYALGAMLYELLTGATPLDSRCLRSAALDEMLRLIREEEPPKPSTRVSSMGEAASATAAYRGTNVPGLAKTLRGDLDWIVMKSLEKDRARRYETASALAADLDRCLRGDLIEARPPSTAYRLRKTAARHRVALTIVSLLGLAMLATTVTVSWALVRERRALNVARTAERKAKEQKETITKLYFRHLLEVVMSGHKTPADLAIQEAADQQILDADRIKYLTGMAELYCGAPSKARDYFDQAIKRKPEWVLPRASIAMTYIVGIGDAAWDRFHEAERIASDRDGELDPFEEIFLEHVRCILDFPKQSSIDKMTQIAESKSIPLADAFLADAYLHVAHDQGDPIAAKKGLARVRKARTYMPNNGYVLCLETDLLWLSAGLTDDPRKKTRLLEDAKEMAEKLRGYPDLPAAVNTRAIFYTLVDDAARLEDVEKEARKEDAFSRYCIASAKYRHHDYAGAAKMLSHEQESTDQFLLLGRAFAIAFTDDGDTEIQAIYRSLRDAYVNKWWFRDYLLLMQRDGAYRLQQIERQIAARSRAGTLSLWEEKLLKYIAGDTDDATARDEICGLESGPPDRCRRSHEQMTFALKCMRLGRPDDAKTHLQQVDKIGYFAEAFWARAYLSRMEDQPWVYSPLRAEG